MKQITVFQADDGRQFQTKFECNQYERKCQRAGLIARYIDTQCTAVKTERGYKAVFNQIDAFLDWELEQVPELDGSLTLGAEGSALDSRDEGGDHASEEDSQVAA